MASSEPHTLSTTIGELPMFEYHLPLGGRSWRIQHTGAILSHEDEQIFLGAEVRLPYGIVLWPAAIALAHDVAARDLKGKRVLEIGAGTGLPGIVAASLGARVKQTDKQETALFFAKKNAVLNGVVTEVVAADWTEWTDTERYDVILGSDVLYGPTMHEHLRHIFETNLVEGGTLLLADPLRKQSFPLLEAMEAAGWKASMSKWTVGVVPPPRSIGVFELTRQIGGWTVEP